MLSLLVSDLGTNLEAWQVFFLVMSVVVFLHVIMGVCLVGIDVNRVRPVFGVGGPQRQAGTGYLLPPLP